MGIVRSQNDCNEAQFGCFVARGTALMKMHLAQLNVGHLVAPTDDPRVKDFMDNLDFINGIGKSMPGFVWMMEGSGEPGQGNTEAKIDGDPQFSQGGKCFKYEQVHTRLREQHCLLSECVVR